MARARSSTAAETTRSRTPATVESPQTDSPARPLPARLADLGLIVVFLALAFLLGCFPLKDTDFWWHLRTGDLIRRGAGLPVTDWYTFGASDSAWIDLHWSFQVLLSLGYEHWGVVGLNLAKCVITCAALALLITARKSDWPVWVMLLAWLPALFLLGGRMYVRPETLTLLYLAAFLAILTRWERWPRLAFALPVIQVLWVNTQGLFVLGPIVLGCAWIDAVLRPGAFASPRRRWWRTVGIASALTLLACLVNPYGVRGALFPLQLAGTMNDPIFSQSIGELMPVVSLSPDAPYSFIGEMGFRNLPLQFHLSTLFLGALSFIMPILWRAVVRLRRAADPEPTPPPATGKRKGRKAKAEPEPTREQSWPLRPFRLLLFAFFGYLSLKATRNSHQFAAVVGAVTAWNLGEWAAAIARRQRAGGRAPGDRPAILPRLATLAVLVLAFVAVASGQLYTWAGEGRTIGLGEEPLWFPHEAAEFAGTEGMPERFVCFHNGHAALYEYHNGPERKVYADARLEVIGPELYGRYRALEHSIASDAPGWSAELAAMGRPGVLVDNVQTGSAPLAASLMAAPGWRCVWFDPIAAVFVPDSYPAARRPVDFVARHFDPEPGTVPATAEELLASADALYDVGFALTGRGRTELARPLLLLGSDHARRARSLNPASARAWKLAGLIESARESTGSPDQPIARFRLPFDPVFDLSPARATYLLREALRRAPDDGKILLALAFTYHGRGMFEAAEPLERRIAVLDPPHQKLSMTRLAQQTGAELAARAAAALGPPPATTWRNLDDLDRLVDANLGTGRAESAAALLERAYPTAARPWNVADRIATLRLHLGQPAQARATWRNVLGTAPRPAVVAARIAATHLVEGDYEAARTAYRRALALEPTLFEALYGLAVVEQDAGRAAAALDAARQALEVAPDAVAAASVRTLIDLVAPYAGHPSEPDESLPTAPDGRSG